MKNDSPPRLILPALRAHMGDWSYFITFMRFRHVAERVKIAEEIHKSKALRDLIQRSLDKGTHARRIKEYLVRERQRMFNSLVIGVYGGAPKWNELKIENSDLLAESDLPDYVEGALGILILDGSEKLFALDGQHRVSGIRQALAENESLRDDEVGAIFVGHRNTPAGKERTRRLFTTLNRYAKPVSKLYIVALDEDDVTAIVTRRLLDEYEFLSNRVLTAQGKNIPRSDRQNVTTIVALYEVLDIYYQLRPNNDAKRLRPPDDKIDEFYSRAVTFLDTAIDVFEPLKQIKKGTKTVADYRDDDGGHLLFRPVGFLMITKIVRSLMDGGLSLEDAMRAVATVPLQLDAAPWRGILWNPAKRRMITSPENQSVARRLLAFAVDLPVNSTELRKEYASLLNEQPNDVKLPKKVRSRHDSTE